MIKYTTPRIDELVSIRERLDLSPFEFYLTGDRNNIPVNKVNHKWEYFVCVSEEVKSFLDDYFEVWSNSQVEWYDEAYRGTCKVTGELIVVYTVKEEHFNHLVNVQCTVDKYIQENYSVSTDWENISHNWGEWMHFAFKMIKVDEK